MGFGHTKLSVFGVAGVLLGGAAIAVGCGAGTELDDYADGIPDVVPVPESAIGSVGGKGGIGSACGLAEVGDDCKGDTSCSTSVTAFSLVNIELEGGYCSQNCTSSADCPTGSGCLDVVGKCLVTCTTDDQCRTDDGYGCESTALLGGEASYCMPPLDIGAILGGAGGLLGGGTTGGGGLFGGTGGTGGLFGGTGGTTGGTGGLFGGTGGTTGGTGGLFGGTGGLFGGTGNAGLEQPSNEPVPE